MKFRVIDPQTGKAPDLMSIYKNEEWSPPLLDWAKNCEFVLHQDGQLDLILDDGDIYKCPPGRFEIKIIKESGIEPEDLLRAGYREFSWNGGVIMEYWKPLGDADDFDHRLGIRFNEWKHIPFKVYIWSGIGGYPVNAIKTVDQLENLYSLLTGKPTGKELGKAANSQ